MKKSLILSIVLLSCCAAQGMQEKSNIATYVAKAKAAYDKAPRTRSTIKWTENLGYTAHGGGELTSEGEQLRGWTYQLDNLQKMLGEKTLYLGVPQSKQSLTPEYSWRLFNSWFGNSNIIPKQYSLLKGFGDISKAYDLYHYELYLMPDDTRLYDVCAVLVGNINWFYQNIYNEDAHDNIAFIAVRPTPGVTKSPFDGKPMPRIVVGFKTIAWLKPADREKVENLIYFLSETIKKDTGCVGTPRYSKRFADSCIFWRHASPDNSSQLDVNTFGIDKDTELFKTNTPATANEYAKWMPSQKVQKKVNDLNKKK